MPYVTVPPAASSSDIPNQQPRFMTDLNDVDFSGFEEHIFYSDGDNDDVGENEHVVADGLGDQTDVVGVGADLGAPIQPPPLRRKPGRPKLLRKRESTEKPKAARSGCVVYGKCKLPRHNSRACKTEGIPIENKKASKKQPTVSEDECAASSSKPSKKVMLPASLSFYFISFLLNVSYFH
ncbi:hypothetical protein LWI29_037397 [Acer saccharum]|uniref:Uncharacterized protein n=1 Tax=Acer saccharum TaxID=4024 RepID=A0AA39RY45_ACESA|nr:hypothetical protein LWI29_037397 [Acer saccharum]